MKNKLFERLLKGEKISLKKVLKGFNHNPTQFTNWALDRGLDPRTCLIESDHRIFFVLQAELQVRLHKRVANDSVARLAAAKKKVSKRETRKAGKFLALWDRRCAEFLNPQRSEEIPKKATVQTPKKAATETPKKTDLKKAAVNTEKKKAEDTLTSDSSSEDDVRITKSQPATKTDGVQKSTPAKEVVTKKTTPATKNLQPAAKTGGGEKPAAKPPVKRALDIEKPCSSGVTEGKKKPEEGPKPKKAKKDKVKTPEVVPSSSSSSSSSESSSSDSSSSSSSDSDDDPGLKK